MTRQKLLHFCTFSPHKQSNLTEQDSRRVRQFPTKQGIEGIVWELTGKWLVPSIRRKRPFSRPQRRIGSTSQFADLKASVLPISPYDRKPTPRDQTRGVGTKHYIRKESAYLKISGRKIRYSGSNCHVSIKLCVASGVVPLAALRRK